MAIDGDNSNEVFSNINERPVDDISLEFFYKPHTITLLTVSIAAVIYSAFTRDEQDMQNNIRAGILCVIFFFLIISVLAFPNGPFTRPHPAVWRMVFGMSVLYLLALLFILFQSYKTVKSIILWIDPSLKDFHIDMDKEYGVNCSDVTIERVWSHIDVFAVGHYFGWMFKAILVRHLGILWAISVMWEFTESLVALAGLHGADFIVPFSSCLTEVLTKLNTGCALRGIKPEPHGYEDGQKIAFAHLLPNFIECWWDALILDVLVCNGLGIWCGLKICKYMEMREYKWVSIRDIRTTSGKIKRAVLQFTPGSWMQVRWLDPSCTYMRFFALCQLVIFWQVSELNTFFLKHIFEMPPSHPIVVVRLILIGVFVAPSVRQYYSYVTNPLCKRVGTQCWVYGAIMVTEAILCIKNGKELFERTQAFNIILWLLLQLLTSILCVYGCVLWHRYIQKEDEMSRDSSPCKTPDSGFVDQKSHIDGITSEIIGTTPNRPKFPWDLKRRAVVSRESQTPDTQTRASL